MQKKKKTFEQSHQSEQRPGFALRQRKEVTLVFKDAAHDQNESIQLETQLAALLGALDYKEGCTAVPIVAGFFFSTPTQ